MGRKIYIRSKHDEWYMKLSKYEKAVLYLMDKEKERKEKVAHDRFWERGVVFGGLNTIKY